MTGLDRTPGGNKSAQCILLARLILALLKQRRRYPLTCATLWAGMQLVFRHIPREGIEAYLVVDEGQIKRFLTSGWDYSEPRLRLLQQVSRFPLNNAGAEQIAAFRQQMEQSRHGTFEVVSTKIYEHPFYPIFQHIGQAFRNYATGREPFVLQTIASLPEPPLRVCDAGCGAGILFGDVLEQIPNAHGVGIDISQRQLQHARQVLEIWGLDGRSNFVRADVRAVPVDDETFDFVLAMEVLEHLPDPASGLDELKRILAPDGWLVTSIPVSDHFPAHLHEFESVDEVRQVHLSAGLQIEHQQVVQVAPGVPNVLSAARK